MATEILTADDLIDGGASAFPAGLLTHTSRVLTAHASGSNVSDIPGTPEDGVPKFPSKSTIMIYYTTNGGANWTQWMKFFTMGVFDFDLVPIAISIGMPATDVQVRLSMSGAFEDCYATVTGITLTCTDGAVASVGTTQCMWLGL